MALVNLITGYDQFNSRMGIFILGTEGFEDFQAIHPCPKNFGGGLLAHDVIHHINGPYVMNQIWDEIEALGSAFFCDGSISLEADLYDVMRQFQWKDQTVPDIGPPIVNDEGIREMFEEFFDQAASNILEDDCVDMSTQRVPWVNRALHGYRKAVQRWNGNCNAAYQAFQRVKDALRNCPELEREGQLLILDTDEGKISYAH